MQKAITNDTREPMFVAGTLIPPGETRVFTGDDIPPEHREAAPPPVEEAPKDRIAEIAEMSVKLIIAVLADLTDEELDRLKAIEEGDKQRKTLIAAIEEAKLERAAKALEAANQATAANPEGQGVSTPAGDGNPVVSGTALPPEGAAAPQGNSNPEGAGE